MADAQSQPYLWAISRRLFKTLPAPLFFWGGTITVTCNSNTLSPSHSFFPTPGCFKRTANDNAGASSGVDNVPKRDQEKTESPLIKKK
ncbi:hypothetical protein CEXT_189481 [Caerostris extrusa]|uniref:Uncharacterized protein n=1 Tax=Caerostris extrusa TaxID=172846 RepID=A0AAV4XKE3_CAEEX|nr:hypothetical protein CEXT_189481 [Caerostris extrusa]